MLDIIGKKNWYFLLSLLIIIPGLVSLSLWGLRLSIDFTGGSRLIFISTKEISAGIEKSIENSFREEKVQIVTIQKSNNTLIVRTKPIDDKKDAALLRRIQLENPTIKQDGYETIGPTIGGETTLNALKAILFASVLIILFITIAFRSVPKPTSSWKFGICAIIALLHDVLVVVGIFSLLGHFLNVEVDSLFVTAILTVIGFSVHDTIVVFDRIRENLRRTIDQSFSQVVNNSILQTLNRSLNTSLTAILVLFTLLIFGGATLFWFIFALLIGIISGTYSSIFNASALLVLWQELEYRQKQKNV